MFYPFLCYLFYILNHFCLVYFSFLQFSMQFFMHFFQTFIQFVHSFEKKKAIDFWFVSKNVYSPLFLNAFICFSLLSQIVFICFSPWSSIAFVCFSKALPREEYVNLVCSIICFWLEGTLSAPVRFHIN